MRNVMTLSDNRSGSVSAVRVWSGRVISGIMVAFFLLDGVLHLMKPAPVLEAFGRLGLPAGLSVGLGVLELVLLVLYLVPTTAVSGAILLTGYLGGAVAIHLRAGSSAFETAFPVILGAAFWLGLFLRRGPGWVSALFGGVGV
jgi:hypothetical protein